MVPSARMNFMFDEPAPREPGFRTSARYAAQCREVSGLLAAATAEAAP